MKISIPKYIEKRLREEAKYPCILSNSTPVISFGNPSTCRVATIGLNPSKREFVDSRGDELEDNRRRFETLSSIGVDGLMDAPITKLQRIIYRSNSYFASLSPYKKWFNQLEPILNALGASYYDNTACHLDIVQWATDPVWSKIANKKHKKILIEDDIPFLLQQLENNTFDIILINGSGVLNELRRYTGVPIALVTKLEGISASSKIFSVGELYGARVVAWSANIQSGFGVCHRLKSEIAISVSKQLR